MAWEERGSCLNIFQPRNHRRISETFMNYEAKDMLRNRVELMLKLELSWRERSMDHVLSNSCEEITSGIDARIGVVMAWEEHGSCLNIFSRVELMLKLELSWRERSMDHVLSNSCEEITSGIDARIGVVMAWEERGSCLNIFQPRNCGRISETFTNYEAKDMLRKVELMLELESSWRGTSVDHVLTYCGRQIMSRIDARIGVVMAWEERGSCLNIFRTRIHGPISETFTNYEAKDLLHK
ncbi:uncharacterized protein G2W53_026510 [Senna tora]|uniref:Uncharacterized protein n=1 Tax=Senna tora TaxID=362788 RepID=A0A834TFT9_9FABA|nr:uncharacterized protein G2W53_026510 [Senna tora]